MKEKRHHLPVSASTNKELKIGVLTFILRIRKSWTNCDSVTLLRLSEN